ncbi:MAG TPA: SWIM zinc finger family protein, partial [Blastocatellia bacterium]|nr:SWIM zinc finger family protein [Blastocatellia bacterium]
MSLAQRFSGSFESRIQSRGRSYYADGRVRIKSGDSSTVCARVRGSENYTVEISVSANGLVASCNCPYYSEDFCKHIYATLLEADDRGLLSDAADVPARVLVDDDDDEEGYDDDYYDDDNDEDDEDLYYIDPAGRPVALAKQGRTAAPQNQNPRSWKEQLGRAARAMSNPEGLRINAWPAGREIFYIIDAGTSKVGGRLALELAFRDLKLNGEWSKLKTQNISRSQLLTIPDPADRQILSILCGAQSSASSSYYFQYGSPYGDVSTRYTLFYPIEQTLIPMMCETGRCRLRRTPLDEELQPLEWEGAAAWEFWLEIRRGSASKQYVVAGSLRRGGLRMEIAEPDLLLAGGLVFARGRVSPLDDFGAFPLISELREAGALYAPPDQTGDLIEALLALPGLPRLDLPPELQFEEVEMAPRPVLKIKKPESSRWGRTYLLGQLSFDYDGEVVAHDYRGRGIYSAEKRRCILRDAQAEQRAVERLKQAGFRQAYHYGEGQVLELNPDKLPRVVRSLVAEGWQVEAEGKLYRQPGQIRIEVSSGIDWFELHGAVEFGDTAAPLPALLAALKRGENVVKLGDGSFGLLPEEWLKKYGPLAGIGAEEGDHLRFTRSQVGLLDALLASQPEASFDETFARARD